MIWRYIDMSGHDTYRGPERNMTLTFVFGGIHCIVNVFAVFDRFKIFLLEKFYVLILSSHYILLGQMKNMSGFCDMSPQNRWGR